MATGNRTSSRSRPARKAGGKARGLNPEQAEAVRTLRGPVLILAGAGSGKTTVITHRIAGMIESGMTAQSIVAVTFTNKSAREMKSRLSSMLERKKLRGMVVSTFHSLGNRILQKDIERLPGYRFPFSILAKEDQENVVADIYRSLRLDPASAKESNVLALLSLCKNAGEEPEVFAERRGFAEGAELFGEIFRRYQKNIRSLNGVDFDDLILLPQQILLQHPEVLEKYRRRWKYFLVDEFQDTNPAQYELLRILVGDSRELCVVGDDDQSIYGWRGADVNIILGFEKNFPGAKVVRLETNYRSTGRILDAANAVICNNLTRTGKKLRAVAGMGEPLRGIIGADEVREAEIISDEIQRRVVQNENQPGDFAILFRTNFQSRAFEQELRNRNIPHHVVGGYKFFDRREVRDLIAYLRVLANPRDETALMRIINRPRRGIGEGSIAKISQFILDQDEEHRQDVYSVLERISEEAQLIPGMRTDAVAAIYEFLELLANYRSKFGRATKLAPVFAELVKELNFEMEFRRDNDNDGAVKARMLNISELINMLAFMEDNWDDSGAPTIFDFLARIALLASDNGEDEDRERGRVQLLTLHLSKGLEFPVVFLTGLEEGLFPASRSLEEAKEGGYEEEALAEERRLYYVGITRAKRELFLSAASSRRKFGETTLVEPSRFWDELPEGTVEWIVREGSAVDEADEQNTLTGLLAGLESLGSPAPSGDA